MHQKAFGGRALPGPAGGVYALPMPPIYGRNGGPTSKGRGEKRGRKKGEGKGRAPKLLVNQGPSEPCYAAGSIYLFRPPDIYLSVALCFTPILLFFVSYPPSSLNGTQPYPATWWEISAI